MPQLTAAFSVRKKSPLGIIIKMKILSGGLSLKTITLTHYIVKDIAPSPWNKTWDNLVGFCTDMASKVAKTGFQLRVRQSVLEELTEDNLMSGNLVTISAEEAGLPETPIEDILELELDFTACPECRTPGGQEFPCRTFKNSEGEECQELPRDFFFEAVLRTAFKAKFGADHCNGSCASCGGCEKEE